MAELWTIAQFVGTKQHSKYASQSISMWSKWFVNPVKIASLNSADI